MQRAEAAHELQEGGAQAARLQVTRAGRQAAYDELCGKPMVLGLLFVRDA